MRIYLPLKVIFTSALRPRLISLFQVYKSSCLPHLSQYLYNINKMKKTHKKNRTRNLHDSVQAIHPLYIEFPCDWCVKFVYFSKNSVLKITYGKYYCKHSRITLCDSTGETVTSLQQWTMSTF